MTYAKAIVGGLVAGLTALGAALVSDGVSASEWVAVALAFLTTSSAVAFTPNKPAA